MIEISTFKVAYQLYVIPTIKVTHNKWLNGSVGIELIWLKWGIDISLPSSIK